MKGKRLYPDQSFNIHQCQPGDYYRDALGVWRGAAPNGLLVNLKAHEVEEHEDGTISVKPSILVSLGEDGLTWHGFLKRGVWSTE